MPNWIASLFRQRTLSPAAKACLERIVQPGFRVREFDDFHQQHMSEIAELSRAGYLRSGGFYDHDFHLTARGRAAGG